MKLLLITMLLASCSWQNPVRSIEKDVERFQRLTPPHFVTYAAKTRTMRLAWNGDAGKRPLFLVHGSPGSWEGWAQFLQNPALLADFHIIAVDRPGFGESGKGITENNLAHQARDIVEALSFNTSGHPAILVGHSFGGPVIAQIAVDYPQKVAGLIFVASSVDPSLEQLKWYQHLATWWPIRALIPTELRVCNEEIYTLKGELEMLAHQLKRINVPVMIVHGDADPLVPVANVDYLQKKLPSGLIRETTILKGMNHFIPWKAPEAILNAIEAIKQQPELVNHGR